MDEVSPNLAGGVDPGQEEDQRAPDRFEALEGFEMEQGGQGLARHSIHGGDPCSGVALVRYQVGLHHLAGEGPDLVR